MNNNLLHLQKSGARRRAKRPAVPQETANQSPAVIYWFERHPPEAQQETARLHNSGTTTIRASLIDSAYGLIERFMGRLAPWIIALAALYLLAQVVRALLS